MEIRWHELPRRKLPDGRIAAAIAGGGRSAGRYMRAINIHHSWVQQLREIWCLSSSIGPLSSSSAVAVVDMLLLLRVKDESLSFLGHQGWRSYQRDSPSSTKTTHSRNWGPPRAKEGASATSKPFFGFSKRFSSKNPLGSRKKWRGFDSEAEIGPRRTLIIFLLPRRLLFPATTQVQRDKPRFQRRSLDPDVTGVPP